MNRRAALPLLLAALLSPVLVSGCGKASPVAPSGSTITLSANPSEITTPSGTSTITAVVRKPNGTVAAGVDVRFTTTIGTIDVLKATDSGGVATATLRGDGRIGTAMVNAAADGAGGSSGGTGGAASNALSVPIGVPISGGAKSITLQANPASIPASGGKVKLIALVRDGTGQPAAGAQVNFTTNLGRLASGGGLVVTNSSGEATDTLSLLSTDVGNQTSITVGAQTAAADGSLVSAAPFTVSILTNAAASIVASANPTQLPLSGGSVTLTALVRNSSGSPVPGAGVNFSASLGTLGSGGGILTTDKNGQVTDSLFIPAQSPPGPVSVTVTAVTPGAGSNLITSNTVTITLSSSGGSSGR